MDNHTYVAWAIRKRDKERLSQGPDCLPYEDPYEDAKENAYLRPVSQARHLTLPLTLTLTYP